jgi:hypothetical protein
MMQVISPDARARSAITVCTVDLVLRDDRLVGRNDLALVRDPRKTSLLISEHRPNKIISCHPATSRAHRTYPLASVHSASLSRVIK